MLLEIKMRHVHWEFFLVINCDNRVVILLLSSLLDLNIRRESKLQGKGFSNKKVDPDYWKIILEENGVKNELL